MTAVSSLDSARKFVRLNSGEEIGFEKLIVATGARVRSQDVPGSARAGIYYLQTWMIPSAFGRRRRVRNRLSSSAVIHRDGGEFGARAACLR
jgi:NADPH-dependent 2,4-dienoyl-CoA reductase/sulfur reductase-like enzyme